MVMELKVVQIPPGDKLVSVVATVMEEGDMEVDAEGGRRDAGMHLRLKKVGVAPSPVTKYGKPLFTLRGRGWHRTTLPPKERLSHVISNRRRAKLEEGHLDDQERAGGSAEGVVWREQGSDPWQPYAPSRRL
jgi:hypothetical protein